MAIQVRRGNEVDFDPNKMLPGEWAVSLDTKYVRMCFSPGICLRMATYEAFEADMEKIESILAEAQTIQETVARIQSEINDTAVVVEDYSVLSKSYAVGGTGKRENEDVDNAKYYYEQAKHISQGGNGLIPLGTIAFENLPTEDILTNGMYNISNDFTSDDRFVDGGGVLYGKGSNVYYTVNGLWDVLAASDVKGVRGSAEDSFRQGNVTITPENLGLENVLPLLGSTDISAIGDGTVTGALDNIVNNKLVAINGGWAAANVDIIGYFVNDAPIGVSIIRLVNPSNAYDARESEFTLYKVTEKYGRIEQRPINTNELYTNAVSNGVWSEWDEYARKSDVTTKAKTPTFSLEPGRWKCYKLGDMCYFSFYYSAKTSDTTITITFPEDMRPSAQYTDLSAVIDSGGNINRPAITSGGVVTLSLKSGCATNGSFVWFAK